MATSMWLIDINRTSHRMISADIKRKLKATTKIIRCTIPYEKFISIIEQQTKGFTIE